MKIEDQLDQENKEKQDLIEKINEYFNLEAELREKKDASTLLRFLGKIPYPNQVISIVLIGFLVLSLYKYSPNLVNWLISSYTLQPHQIVQGFSVTVMTSLILGWGFVMLFWQVGGWIIPPLKAKLRNKTVLDMYTSARAKEFVVPKNCDKKKPMWKVDDNLTFAPNDDDVFIGPNNVRVMSATPEHGRSFNPRRLLMDNKVDNIDMTVIDQNAELAKEEARAELRSGMDALKPFIGPIVILVTILTIMMIPILRYTDQGGEVNHWRDKYEIENRLNSKLSQQVIQLGGEPADYSSITVVVPVRQEVAAEPPDFPGTGLVFKEHG